MGASGWESGRKHSRVRNGTLHIVCLTLWRLKISEFHFQNLFGKKFCLRGGSHRELHRVYFSQDICNALRRLSSSNMSNRPTIIRYPSRGSCLAKKPRTMITTFGHLVTGSCMPGGSRGNYRSTYPKPLTPARISFADSRSTSTTFLE